MQSDFEAITAGALSEPVVITDCDGVSITLPCLFDAPVQHFDPEVSSHVLFQGTRITVAETIAIRQGFNLRRAGLTALVRGELYKFHGKDWEFDGLGQLVIYLDRIGPLG